MHIPQNITVLGDGAFGTAFAQLLAHNGHTVTLWCYNSYIAHAINAQHENTKYLPGIKLNTTIIATTSFETALANRVIFEAIPMMFLADTLRKASDFSREDHCWVSLTKGMNIHNNNVVLTTDLIENITNNKNNVVVSGPSYAQELATLQPTGLVVASKDMVLAEMIKNLIQSSHLITHYSPDTHGIQLIAALKNVCALGIGILEGAGYANNTQALFIIQALEEIKKILRAYKIPEITIMETLYGLAGIGDLMLTCFGKTSRNYRFGYARGQGQNYADSVAQMGIAPEGVNTLSTLETVSKNYSVQIPLLVTLYDIVFKNGDAKNLIDQLLKH